MPFKIGPLEMLLMVRMVLMFLTSLAIYLLPTIIAAFRRHPNALAIFLIDFLLGWTAVGWIGALVWSLIKPEVTVAGSGNALDAAKGRYARGEISKEQFEEIKRNIQ